MSNTPSPKKLNVLITGCSSGIGRALAIRFNQLGHRVFATARNKQRLAELVSLGGEAIELDVNNSEQIQAAYEQVSQQVSELHILVNNAGYAMMGAMLELPKEQLHQQFATNVYAPIEVSKTFLPFLKKASPASVVNIGSVSGLVTTPFGGAYSATKAALHMVSDAMRMELKPFDIDVVTVQPGAIQSEFGNNASQALEATFSEDSDYVKIVDAIKRRANISQENPTSAEAFAKDLVDALLEPAHPKPVIRLGKSSRLVPIVQQLPARLRDRLLSKSFKLNQI